MCGKFTQMMSWRTVRDLSDLVGRAETVPLDEMVIGTPMRLCQVIHLDSMGARINSAMRWGFVDVRAKPPLDRPKHMHARAETIDQLPTFARAFASSRGILLTKTRNVGQELPSGKTVQHTITPRDGQPIAIAVIWERWENRNEGTLLAFVMVTTPPNPLIATVADRMSAILQPEDWPLWLGEADGSLEQIKAMLRPHNGDWDMTKQNRPGRHTVPGGPSQPALF